MVQFYLRDFDVGFDYHIADSATPVCQLQAGYRSIPLYYPNNQRTGAFGYASMLVEIDISGIKQIILLQIVVSLQLSDKI